MWMKTLAASAAGLVLAPTAMSSVAAVPAQSLRAATPVVGLWDADFEARMTATDCGSWRLDVRGFCTADDVRNGVELGMKFQTSRELAVTGIRVYRIDLGTVTGSLWDADGTRLATGRFASTDTPGWQDLAFSRPVTISPGRTYLASYYSPATRYAFHYDYFANELTRGPITALRAVDDDPNGVYCYDVGSCRFPTRSFRNSSYWVTPVWENPVDQPLPPSAVPAPPADRKPPSVRAANPMGGQKQFGLGTSVKATFSENIRASLLTRANVRLLQKGSRTPVRARLRYNVARLQLVLDPLGRLQPHTTYRVVISTLVVDTAGNPLDQDPRRPGAQPATWTFRTR